MNPSDIQRFMSKVIKAHNCWLWIGSKTSGGYGQFCVNGEIIYSHRISYQLFKGDIPTGLQLDHLCRTRNCVNPDHLEAVSQKINLLRGNGIGAKNSQKTHCPKGHLYSEKNKKGFRRCRICLRAQDIKYKNKKTIKY